MAGRARGWCFTLNNFTEEDELRLVAPPDSVKYVVYGHEVGESGTPHLQGAVWFKSVKSLAQVKEYVGATAHCEKVRGQPSQAIAYCKKDGAFVELGTPPKDAKEGGKEEKERWHRAWELAKEGKIEEIAEESPDIALRCYATLKRVGSDYAKMPEAQAELDFHWWYGETGTGKSRTAREENPSAYIKLRNKWWDGYKDQPCVIIEEWSPEDSKYLAQHLKQWADHHPFTAEVKGGTIYIRPPKIIITSNYSMEDCFVDERDLAPLQRRFKVRHFLGE